MRRKTILTCVPMLVLLFNIVWVVNLGALAAGDVRVQVKDVSVSEPGQTVTTDLYMDGTFAAFQGVLVYDTDALTLDKIEATSLLSAGMTRFNQDEITGAFTSGAFVSASANNAEISGAVLTFTFTAGSNASGTYSFSVEQLLVYDEEGVPLTVNAVDTTVVPITPAPATPAPTERPTTPAQESPPASATETPTPAPTPRESAPAPTANDPDPAQADASEPGVPLPIIAALAAVAAIGIAVVVVRTRKGR